MPVPAGVQAVVRSMISAEIPRPRKARPSASPAIPAPTISTDGGSDKERFVRSAAGIGAASLRQPRYYGWARRVVACLRRFFARECSNEECGGASHWNPDTLVTPVAFVCGASLFLTEERGERGESQWIRT